MAPIEVMLRINERRRFVSDRIVVGIRSFGLVGSVAIDNDGRVTDPHESDKTTRRVANTTEPDLPVRALYIFPHAGGSASAYAPFARAFSLDIKRIAVQYPGRADRHDVPDIESIPALAKDVYTMLAANNITDAPVAFFGHSMGGLIAFEVARRFEADGAPSRPCSCRLPLLPGTAGTSNSRAPTMIC